MVLAGFSFPPDIRVEKEARALIAGGYSVHLLCDRKSHALIDEQWEGIEIHRLDYRSSGPPWLRRLNTFGRLVVFLDFIWLRGILKEIDRHDIGVLHVHDLPMVRTALWAGRRRRIPVIADLHENYPEAIRHYYSGSGRTGLKGWLRSNRGRWQRYETATVSKCDAVIAVVDEGRERLIAAGIPGGSVTVVENTEDLEHFETLGIDAPLLEKYRSNFVISYVGGFGAHRGLDTAIKAMPEVLDAIPNALLLLVGDGRIRHELEKLAHASGVGNSVEFAGSQPFRLIPTFIEASEVCLVPHHSTPQTEAALPHKIFQYWALNKPVVVSSCQTLKRVVEETGGGLVFDAGDPHSLAQKIASLADPKLRAQLGTGGARVARERYDWRRVTSKKLLDVYARIADGPSRSGMSWPGK